MLLATFFMQPHPEPVLPVYTRYSQVEVDAMSAFGLFP